MPHPGMGKGNLCAGNAGRGAIRTVLSREFKSLTLK